MVLDCPKMRIWPNWRGKLIVDTNTFRTGGKVLISKQKAAFSSTKYTNVLRQKPPCHRQTKNMTKRSNKSQTTLNRFVTPESSHHPQETGVNLTSNEPRTTLVQKSPGSDEPIPSKEPKSSSSSAQNASAQHPSPCPTPQGHVSGSGATTGAQEGSEKSNQGVQRNSPIENDNSPPADPS